MIATNNDKGWYTINDINKLDSPCLVVYPERVVRNIDMAIAMAGDANRLRPHIKTSKSAQVTRLMQQAGIRKFKCATVAEAEMLGLAMAGDVLLAYQPVGPKIQRLISLIQKYPDTQYSCLVDCLEAAKEMSRQFSLHAVVVGIYLDLNVGMNRTGIRPGQDAFELYVELQGLPGLRPVGFHVYDGHIRFIRMEQRVIDCDQAFSPVDELKKRLMACGLPEPAIIAGGTLTYPFHVKREGCECSPGTFVYWDYGYNEICKEQDFAFAAVLVTRIISMPDATKICVDLGYKSVASESEINRRIHFLNAKGLSVVSHSEEHLVLDAGDCHEWRIGDVLYGVPEHICPTVALFERVYTAEGHVITGEWLNIARDRVICI